MESAEAVEVVARSVLAGVSAGLGRQEWRGGDLVSVQPGAALGQRVT